tara:strand:+ start:141 stop:539 length:399 start_codon:yes stop_codon:yes gene_type:complete
MTLESPVSAFSDVHFTSSKIMSSNKQLLQLFQAGRLQEAEVLIQKMIASNLLDAEGWHLAAVIASQQKKYSEAGLRIEQCLERDNAKAEFWNSQGAILLELLKTWISCSENCSEQAPREVRWESGDVLRRYF